MDASGRSKKLRSDDLNEFSTIMAKSQPVLLDVREPIEPRVTCGLLANARGTPSETQTMPAAASVSFR